jgi:hypothetical protein
MMRPHFPWLCHQEPLPWHSDHMNSSCIPLHAHGPNMLARDEPPIHQLGLEFYLFMGPPFFLLRSILLISWGSLGETSQGLIFWLLYFSSYFYPLAFSPFFPQGKVQPLTIMANPVPEPMQGIDEREDDEK